MNFMLISNYFKIIWRFIIKNKRFSFINIIGLSLSVAFCLLLFFYIRNEQSFDSFHLKKKNLYRLEMTNIWKELSDTPRNNFFSFLNKQDNIDNQLLFPLATSEDIQNAFPEVKSITRIKDVGALIGPQIIESNDHIFKEKQILYVDQNFFANFSFPLIIGNPKKVFLSKYDVVLSETVAHKYFGGQQPIGRIIHLEGDSTKIFRIAGIAKDAPSNSSIQFGLIFPINAESDYETNLQNRFSNLSHIMIVELAEGTKVASFEVKLNRWVKEHFASPYILQFGQPRKKLTVDNIHWELRQLENCHYNVSFPWGHYTNMSNIYQLTCLVGIILLIASLNYVLLAVSQAAARRQEIGMRKVMGANRIFIIVQFWMETQTIVAFSVLIGLAIALFTLPYFNTIIETGISITEFSWYEIAIALLLLSLLLGVLAGYYPALIQSKMAPVSVLKGAATFKINPRFSNIIVISQYSICIILIVAALVINRQMHYVSDKNLGFDKDNILVVESPGGDYGVIKRTYDGLKDFARQDPLILQFSGITGGLIGQYSNVNGFILNGKQEWLIQMGVDYNYAKALGINIVEGRFFSEKMATDSARSAGIPAVSKPVMTCVVNQTLFSLLGKEAVVGQYCKPINSIILGVVEDYHFDNLKNRIKPEQHILTTTYFDHFLFKIQKHKMQEAITKIEVKWKAVTGNYPFEYSFLEQSITKMYQPELKWRKIIQSACFFAMLIGSLGLFGLSAINASNRLKEIGIRKVFGATFNNVVLILAKQLLNLVGISILIAVPISWWIMNKWLEDFAYRINISWEIFFITAIVAYLIALIPVSYHNIRAAISNPVRVLKME
jgi:putative ABC transport system permease protein